MATASKGQATSSMTQQNRCRLLRLQMLIIDGGLRILRNILDTKLKNVSLSAFLQQERSTINKLRTRGIITQVQYDLLFPSLGIGPTTTDLDITLIICLLRNIKSFGLNKHFQWNSIPAQGDASLEADISRLKIYRNEVLLRLNTAVSPIPDLQMMIDDFKVKPLDPQAEKRIQKAIDSWHKLETGVEAELKLLKMEDEKIKCTLKLQDQITRKQTQSIGELNKKTCEHDKQIHDHALQIQELKLKEETRKDDKAEAESKYEESKQKLKDELITWYKTYQSTVPLSPLTDAVPTPLAGFYIMPEIDIQTYQAGGRKETTRVKSLQDLFSSCRTVQKEIYLSADAGFGKTAFSKYLALTWCQAHQNDDNYKHFKEEELKALSGFECLFLVLLRDSAKVCDVDDMIEEQLIQNLPCSSSIPEGLLKDILRDEKCLVILDGLDEWTHPDNDCSRLPKTIPHRYAREKCVILTTTRPWKLGMSNLNQIGGTIELAKLNKDNARQFKCKAMKTLNKKLNDNELKNEVCRFEEAISDHDLEYMESTPLLLLYLICLWVEKIPIGNSAVELYTDIIQLLLYRTEKLHGKFHSSCKTPPSYVPECFRKNNHFCRYYTFLLTIGKLAFYTLFSKTKEHALVFDEKIAERYLNQEDLKSSCLSGLLSESKVKTLINERFKISFLHKTVQEYFSAIFISFQNSSEVQKILYEECHCLQNILDKSKVFVFISNMNPKLMSAISSDLMPVINNDEITIKYRTLTRYDRMYIMRLQDIQDMYISCAKERKENKDLKLCLQDFVINENCQQENYLKQLQQLCQQNKENIKSIMIENKGICSLQEIIKLFTLSDLPHIEKLCYCGEIVGMEIMSLFLNPLKCLTVISSKLENHQCVGKRRRLSAEINGRLVTLQHLECLNIEYFTMTHQVMETLFNILTSKKSMKDIILYSLYCSDHKNTSCTGFNLDLSQHSQLSNLRLSKIPVSQLNIDVSLLEECCVGELYKPGVVSSYLSQLPEASKLQTFKCRYLESSSDIDTMLQTLPLLHHLKDVWLSMINLGERSLKLSPEMISNKSIYFTRVAMSCSVLHDLITVINKLSNTLAVSLRCCDIKPDREFKKFKTFIKHSDDFVVTYDGTMKSGDYWFEFKTTTNLK
ncbi:uncharacterized protein LOC132756749 [Ruditapes philippinarum]|uniref:uncharacterized protein LOC132756749 n=1 Tax=Ruditapes philippinarum TaxID=129788 RepID=UPI00295BA613|nr:uncharacterized protein LOC132756749 [Ruditapes philippinarum]